MDLQFPKFAYFKMCIYSSLNKYYIVRPFSMDLKTQDGLNSARFAEFNSDFLISIHETCTKYRSRTRTEYPWSFGSPFIRTNFNWISRKCEGYTDKRT